MEFIKVDPRKVLYSQYSIRPRFRDDELIEDTIDQLVSGEISPKNIEHIRVCTFKGKMHSLDNRRLYAFREAIKRGCSFRTVPAIRSYEFDELKRKMTSPPSPDYSVIKVRRDIYIPEDLYDDDDDDDDEYEEYDDEEDDDEYDEYDEYEEEDEDDDDEYDDESDEDEDEYDEEYYGYDYDDEDDDEYDDDEYDEYYDYDVLNSFGRLYI